MKKFILSAILLAGAALSAGAQFYVGGSLAAEGYAGGADSRVCILLAPSAGYTIDARQTVGVGLGLTYTGETIGFGLHPTYAYKLAGISKFGLWARASGILAYDMGIGGTEYSRIQAGLSVYPEFTFRFRKRFEFFSSLNFATASAVYSHEIRYDTLPGESPVRVETSGLTYSLTANTGAALCLGLRYYL